MTPLSLPLPLCFTCLLFILKCVYKKYEKHFSFFQPLPEKKSFSKHFDRFTTEFLKSRQIALNKFLSRIADHPVMSFNDNFHVFLTAKTWVGAVSLNTYVQQLLLTTKPHSPQESF